MAAGLRDQEQHQGQKTDGDQQRQPVAFQHGAAELEGPLPPAVQLRGRRGRGLHGGRLLVQAVPLLEPAVDQVRKLRLGRRGWVWGPRGGVQVRRLRRR
jgi:hypothetical protein